MTTLNQLDRTWIGEDRAKCRAWLAEDWGGIATAGAFLTAGSLVTAEARSAPGFFGIRRCCQGMKPAMIIGLNHVRHLVELLYFPSLLGHPSFFTMYSLLSRSLCTPYEVVVIALFLQSYNREPALWDLCTTDRYETSIRTVPWPQIRLISFCGGALGRFRKIASSSAGSDLEFQQRGSGSILRSLRPGGWDRIPIPRSTYKQDNRMCSRYRITE